MQDQKNAETATSLLHSLQWPGRRIAPTWQHHQLAISRRPPRSQRPLVDISSGFSGSDTQLRSPATRAIIPARYSFAFSGLCRLGNQSTSLLIGFNYDNYDDGANRALLLASLFLRVKELLLLRHFVTNQTGASLPAGLCKKSWRASSCFGMIDLGFGTGMADSRPQHRARSGLSTPVVWCGTESHPDRDGTLLQEQAAHVAGVVAMVVDRLTLGAKTVKTVSGWWWTCSNGNDDKYWETPEIPLSSTCLSFRKLGNP